MSKLLDELARVLEEANHRDAMHCTMQFKRKTYFDFEDLARDVLLAFGNAVKERAAKKLWPQLGCDCSAQIANGHLSSCAVEIAERIRSIDVGEV